MLKRPVRSTSVPETSPWSAVTVIVPPVLVMLSRMYSICGNFHLARSWMTFNLLLDWHILAIRFSTVDLLPKTWSKTPRSTVYLLQLEVTAAFRASSSHRQFRYIRQLSVSLNRCKDIVDNIRSLTKFVWDNIYLLIIIQFQIIFLLYTSWVTSTICSV